jgi:hypothetical protein
VWAIPVRYWECHGLLDDPTRRLAGGRRVSEVAVAGATPAPISARDLIPTGRPNSELAMRLDGCGDEAGARIR